MTHFFQTTIYAILVVIGVTGDEPRCSMWILIFVVGATGDEPRRSIWILIFYLL